MGGVATVFFIFLVFAFNFGVDFRSPELEAQVPGVIFHRLTKQHNVDRKNRVGLVLHVDLVTLCSQNAV